VYYSRSIKKYDNTIYFLIIKYGSVLQKLTIFTIKVNVFISIFYRERNGKNLLIINKHTIKLIEHTSKKLST